MKSVFICCLCQRCVYIFDKYFFNLIFSQTQPPEVFHSDLNIRASPSQLTRSDTIAYDSAFNCILLCLKKVSYVVNPLHLGILH